MKLYCKVENNVVINPPNVLSIQLSLKSDFELLEEGWYTVEQILPDTFDQRFEVMNPIEYEILQYKVRATYTKRQKTSEELQEFIDVQTQDLQQQQTSALVICEDMLNPSGSIYNTLSIQEREHWLQYKRNVEQLFIINEGKNVWEITFPMIPTAEPPPSQVLPPI